MLQPEKSSGCGARAAYEEGEARAFGDHLALMLLLRSSWSNLALVFILDSSCKGKYSPASLLAQFAATAFAE
ncbi:unnamed protein product [Peronospora belbahrii]|uniref:Uncharacterized protein n=1 Tax=Peronospora belbahrii TaxID=622444 RepID=A0AAU9KQF6_9STRA|nr:unnamed protein product [Peronospora belbahrii]CAH0474409.1 unnamed protein product [Peronospora belbahrii]CAH0516896.1 unnamed protein product [Peronospora belbahrii]